MSVLGQFLKNSSGTYYLLFWAAGTLTRRGGQMKHANGAPTVHYQSCLHSLPLRLIDATAILIVKSYHPFRPAGW